MTSDEHTTPAVLNDMDAVLARLKDIASVVTQAAEAETLELVLERIAKVSRELVNARYCALGVPDPEGGLRYFKVAGLSPERVSKIEHLPVGRGLLGAIMREREVVRLERMQDDPRSSGFCDNHPPMTSLLGVPVQLGRQLFGILYLCDREDGQPFTEHDQWLIEIMGSYAALAIAGSRLREKRARLAMLEERERIGMELHDGVIQSVYAVGMQVDLLRAAAPGPQAEGLEHVVEGLNAVIEEIRSYIQDLKATSYRGQTIYETLHEVIQRAHLPQSLEVELDAPHLPAPLTPGTVEAICQIMNEAVSNVKRHAHATRIHIRAGFDESLFQMTIEDNGRGFDPREAGGRGGMGLQNIQRRAQLHGGSVALHAVPGEGTRLILRIPVAPPERR